MAFFSSNSPLQVKLIPYTENNLTKEQWIERLQTIEDTRINKQLLSDLFDRAKMSSSDFNFLKETTIPLLIQLLPSIHYDLSVKF